MLSIVTFKWKPAPTYRSQYSAEVVNVLAAMVRRRYRDPHEFVCITDDPRGLDARIRVVPLWDDFAHLPAPQGSKNPSCYRRLKLFSGYMATLIGPRFIALDLDIVLTGDVTALWNRSEDFVMVGETNPKTPYNGSMILLTAGARLKVWETFDPQRSPQLAKQAGFYGSDQGWISYCLGKGEATWTRKDGVYCYRNHLIGERDLPANARVILFNGKIDPWASCVNHLPWIQAHYR